MKDYNEFGKKTNRLDIEGALPNPSNFHSRIYITHWKIYETACIYQNVATS